MAERSRKSTEIYRLAPGLSSFHTTWGMSRHWRLDPRNHRVGSTVAVRRRFGERLLLAHFERSLMRRPGPSSRVKPTPSWLSTGRATCAVETRAAILQTPTSLVGRFVHPDTVCFATGKYR